jgi:hypothetical protein
MKASHRWMKVQWQVTSFEDQTASGNAVVFFLEKSGAGKQYH